MELDKDLSKFLSSRITVNARVVTSIRKVRASLGAYPGLIEVGYGSGIKYLIDCEREAGKFYLLSLSRSAIVFEVFSKVSPLYLMRESLLRLLSISAMLSEDYEFDMRSLFPYLIEVLACQELKGICEVRSGADANCGGDIILARRITQLLKERRAFSSALDAASSKLARITALFIICRYGHAGDVNEIARDCGLTDEEVERALGGMHEIGYKRLPSRSGRFTLVRE